MTETSLLGNNSIDSSNLRAWSWRLYITGKSAVPPQFITNESGIQIFNPDFVARQRQDQLLTLWLLSSINSDILPQFVWYDSAHSIWEAVNQLFATQILFWSYELQIPAPNNEEREPLNERVFNEDENYMWYSSCLWTTNVWRRSDFIYLGLQLLSLLQELISSIFELQVPFHLHPQIEHFNWMCVQSLRSLLISLCISVFYARGLLISLPMFWVRVWSLLCLLISLPILAQLKMGVLSLHESGRWSYW